MSDRIFRSPSFKNCFCSFILHFSGLITIRFVLEPELNLNFDLTIRGTDTVCIDWTLHVPLSHHIVHCRSPEEQFHSFSTIGEEELYKIVKSAKPTTCMLDPIPSKLLKEVLPEVIDPILAIINSSLLLGNVPKTFKLAVIKPLIKKTELYPKYLVNYRPISNLPFLSKILEKVASSQLYSFLEKNDICEDFQSGFRSSHSTETALIRLTNDLLLSSDHGCISLLVLLDLSAAFDTIDHNILLNRLENFVAISGSALALFKSYLSDAH